MVVYDPVIDDAAERGWKWHYTADGTLNLVHYAAWLVKEMSRRGD